MIMLLLLLLCVHMVYHKLFFFIITSLSLSLSLQFFSNLIFFHIMFMYVCIHSYCQMINYLFIFGKQQRVTPLGGLSLFRDLDHLSRSVENVLMNSVLLMNEIGSTGNTSAGSTRSANVAARDRTSSQVKASGVSSDLSSLPPPPPVSSPTLVKRQTSQLVKVQSEATVSNNARRAVLDAFLCLKDSTGLLISNTSDLPQALENIINKSMQQPSIQSVLARHHSDHNHSLGAVSSGSFHNEDDIVSGGLGGSLLGSRNNTSSSSSTISFDITVGSTPQAIAMYHHRESNIRRFLLDLLKCRSDFKDSYGRRAAWVKELFPDFTNAGVEE
jgi:hypothetical protein